MKFGGNSQRSLNRVEGVRKVHFPFSSVFPTWSPDCFPQVDELLSSAFRHGPECWIRLFLKLVARCLLNIGIVDVGSGILVRFPFFSKLHVVIKNLWFGLIKKVHIKPCEWACVNTVACWSISPCILLVGCLISSPHPQPFPLFCCCLLGVHWDLAEELIHLKNNFFFQITF